MKQSKILLTGYKNTRYDQSTSKILLDKIEDKYDKYLFSNDFDKIKREIESLHIENYDYIIMFGQKPIIKKPTMELSARIDSSVISTNFDMDALFKVLKGKGLPYRISRGAGTSYCNFTYFNMLSFINENQLKTKALFIHIPYLKNFIDMDNYTDLINNGGVLCQKLQK